MSYEDKYLSIYELTNIKKHARICLDGGWGAHGGGAFSGKDPSKVDRSAAYYARWIAKSLVKSGVCSRCLVQIAYGIGVPAPISVHVETYGTAKIPEEKVIQLVNKNFDMRAGCLVRELNLKRP